MVSEEIVEAKVTFVVHGGEVLAIFRAVRDAGSGKWIREKPYLGRCTGKLCLNCYAHVGQHGVCDPAILKCRRATPEEYAPLLAEMESIGYRITPHQRGRLKQRSTTKGK